MLLNKNQDVDKVKGSRVLSNKSENMGKYGKCGLDETEIDGAGLSRCEANMSKAEAKESDRGCDSVIDDKLSLTHRGNCPLFRAAPSPMPV